MFHVIYRTTNTINGKYYFGIHSTKDLNDRYLGSGIVLNRAIKKYGRSVFKKEIIASFDTRQEALDCERRTVTKELVENQKCYNRSIGGNSHIEDERKWNAYTNCLKGNERTQAQKAAAKLHSKRMKGKLSPHCTPVSIFGQQFKSTKEARDKLQLSTSQYYYYLANPHFKTVDELKNHIWTERNKKISKAKMNGG